MSASDPPVLATDLASYGEEQKELFIKALWNGVSGVSPREADADAVEIVRHIAAADLPQAAETDRSAAARALAADLNACAAAGDLDTYSPDSLTALIAALCRLYSRRHEVDPGTPALASRDAISGTEAMVMCTGLLRAVDLQVFELGMWQAWSR